LYIEIEILIVSVTIPTIPENKSPPKLSFIVYIEAELPLNPSPNCASILAINNEKATKPNITPFADIFLSLLSPSPPSSSFF